MKKTRTGVFETNSSSTHSMSLFMKEDYDKWVSGELYFNVTEDELVTEEEAKLAYFEEEGSYLEMKSVNEVDVKDMGYPIYTHKEWMNAFDEPIEESITTPKGDVVIGLGGERYC